MTNENTDVVNYRLQQHQEQLDRLNKALEMIAGSLNKLAILEERHNETRTALDRAFNELRECGLRVHGLIDECNERIDLLEKSRYKWVDMALASVLTAVVVWAMTKVLTP